MKTTALDFLKSAELRVGLDAMAIVFLLIALDSASTILDARRRRAEKQRGVA